MSCLLPRQAWKESLAKPKKPRVIIGGDAGGGKGEGKGGASVVAVDLSSLAPGTSDVGAGGAGAGASGGASDVGAGVQGGDVISVVHGARMGQPQTTS